MGNNFQNQYANLYGNTPQNQSNFQFWRRSTDARQKINPASVWFSRDYDNFHGVAGTNGARRYAYIDGHVSDYEN